LGAGRTDKGFAALAEIADATHARDASIQFRIQRAGSGQGLQAAERALAQAPNVTLLPAFLEDEAYARELGEAHVVLLAYDVALYARRGSGVFVDAMLTGAPLVCVANTALARALDGNGVAGTGAEGLAAAIVVARGQYEALAAGAAQTRDAAFAAIQRGPLIAALQQDAL
jgi:hypothetical protein